MEERISILMYHQVGDFPAPGAHRSTYCHHQRFARQMAFLARFGFHVLSLDQALACLEGTHPTPRRAVVLTFDDGYESFHEYAWPVLRQYGFPAIVYLLSDYIGRSADWFAADGRDTPPLMGRERILQLRSEGVDFGSHGRRHLKLAESDPQTVEDEVAASKRELESLLGEEVRHFCYPYGSHEATTLDIVERAGYRSGVTCQRAAATHEFHPLALPRKAISFGDSLAGYWWKVTAKNEPRFPPVRWRADQ